jgi:DEAD/DEAH box helicase domain-containing protein
MSEIAVELIKALNLDVIETLDLPGRPEARQPLPSALVQGPLASLLSQIAPDGTVWRHQALSIKKLVAGDNVVVATGTASGKSLVFQLYALDRVLRDPNAKVLVFYPLKALSSDQNARWLAIAERAGLPPTAVARIDGDTIPASRNQVLEAARIVLMTPDVCQAWLMRNVGSSLIRRFMENLSLLVLDEAHVYESVFGSNVAFLLRRMITAKRRATRNVSDQRRFQVIAATATIAEPAQHLRELTGLEFSVVSEEDNGAPFHPRTIIHVNGAEYGAAGEAALADLASGAANLAGRHRFIGFMDSRQGVERIVRQLNKPDILPYRSGYEATDRKRIEEALRSGSLDGVIATSALELGIDVADMEIGINLGIPQSRKAFRQRVGRVGRSCPGVFFVIATPNAFKRFGETFEDYYRGSVEPSYLYLGNRFIQFAHARCLLDEVEVLGGEKTMPPTGASWPDGYEKILQYAKPGGGRPREFDFIAQLGADAPHFNYPLRQVGEASFELKEGNGDYRLGSIATNQAIREAYPGANYLHMGHAYKVLEWRTRSLDRSIRLVSATSPVNTRPLLRKSVTLSLSMDGIVEGRIKRSKTGLVAEAHLQVNESVEGYRLGSTSYLYRDLRAENPNMSRKQRDFRTTGIVIKIEEPWFAGANGTNPKVREQVAEGLLKLICRDRSIAPQDVDATHTNIALMTEAGPRRLTDAIVIYDSVYGGLRLTEDLYIELNRYIEQLSRAADLAGGDAIVDELTAQRLADWSGTLGEGLAGGDLKVDLPDGWYQVYRPGSVVSVLHNGNFVEREIVEPKLADLFNSGQKSLYYRYRTDSGSGFVPHDQISATGQEWSWILWNATTGDFQELEGATPEELPAGMAAN